VDIDFIDLFQKFVDLLFEHLTCRRQLSGYDPLFFPIQFKCVGMTECMPKRPEIIEEDIQIIVDNPLADSREFPVSSV
jgi:hypothetical protein